MCLVFQLHQKSSDLCQNAITMARLWMTQAASLLSSRSSLACSQTARTLYLRVAFNSARGIRTPATQAEDFAPHTISFPSGTNSFRWILRTACFWCSYRYDEKVKRARPVSRPLQDSRKTCRVSDYREEAKILWELTVWLTCIVGIAVISHLVTRQRRYLA